MSRRGEKREPGLPNEICQEDEIMRQCEESRKESYANALQCPYHQWCGGGGGVVWWCGVGIRDDGHLLALSPVPCQQHGGVLTEVLVDLGK